MGYLRNKKKIAELEAGGGGGGGSNVSIEQKIDEGVNIADIIINGIRTKLFAPTGGASSESEEVSNWSLSQEGQSYLETIESSFRADGHVCKGFIRLNVLLNISTLNEPIQIAQLNVAPISTVRIPIFGTTGVRVATLIVDNAGNASFMNEGNVISTSTKLLIDLDYFIS